MVTTDKKRKHLKGECTLVNGQQDLVELVPHAPKPCDHREKMVYGIWLAERNFQCMAGAWTVPVKRVESLRL